MSIQIIAILYFGKTLMMCGLDTMLTLLNICINLMNISITSELIGILVSFIMYGIPRIFKYNFD